MKSRPPSPGALAAHVSVVESLYYQQPNEQPESFPSNQPARFLRWTKSNESPYSRKVMVTSEWSSLDPGWITECSMLHIVNEKTVLNHNPTEAESRLLESLVLEIAFVEPSPPNDEPRTMFSGDTVTPSYTPVLYLLPGEHVRLPVIDVKSVRLRCRNESTRCVITLLPA